MIIGHWEIELTDNTIMVNYRNAPDEDPEFGASDKTPLGVLDSIGTFGSVIKMEVASIFKDVGLISQKQYNRLDPFY